MAIDWNKPEERKRFWHSSAHIMAAAVVELFPGTKLTIGPPIEEGFYYDFAKKEPFTPEDFEKIEKKMKEIAKKNDKFEFEEISREKAKELFKDNKYKLELIDEIPEGEKITIYKTGEFVDLCKGPHIDYSSRIKAMKVIKSSSAYWRGNSENDTLQRLYAITFPNKEMMENYLKKKEEAEKRNHIKLGKELDLLSMKPEAPGCVFLHDKGTTIWNTLIDFSRKEHRKRGYKEVMAPIILKKDLWLKSGHWDHYKENMYFTKIDEEDYAVKPMNCPGHMLIYNTKRHSYRDLPIRMAEFGMVHRHELSGVLNGLLRVRKFTQDDAHIFCTPEQVEEEVRGVINLIDYYYSEIFGFEYHMELSTKPEKAMGRQEDWDKAEATLKKILDKTGKGYKINEGDGAFYGPKIDFHIKDSLGRSWQLGTVQLDFQMPEKFDITYVDKDDKEKRPVMLHRVVFGSMERFMAILIEHFGGVFPVWLAPVQARVIGVSDKHIPYAKKIHEQLIQAEIRADIDTRTETVGSKVRDAQLEKIPFIINVGDKEEEAGTIAIRNKEGKVEFGIKIDDFILRIKELNETKK